MTLLVEALGTCARVCVDDLELAADVSRLLDPMRRRVESCAPRHHYTYGKAEHDRDDQWRLERDGVPLLVSRRSPRMVPVLVNDLNREAIAACQSPAVHAGAVALGERAVLFPAVSGTGKSTMVAACVAAGFSYLTDEAVAFDDDLTAHPYPKPIALSPESLRLLRLPPLDGPGRSPKRLLTADDLGGRTERAQLDVGHIVLLERTAGDAELRPSEASTAAAALLSLSFNHFKDPVGAFDVASGIAQRATSWTLSAGDPRAAADLLVRALS